jgi:hypothetical protein
MSVRARQTANGSLSTVAAVFFAGAANPMIVKAIANQNALCSWPIDEPCLRVNSRT